jgi:hypothetical protein
MALLNDIHDFKFIASRAFLQLYCLNWDVEMHALAFPNSGLSKMELLVMTQFDCLSEEIKTKSNKKACCHHSMQSNKFKVVSLDSVSLRETYYHGILEDTLGKSLITGDLLKDSYQMDR